MTDSSSPRIIKGLRNFVDKLRGLSVVIRWNFHPHIKDQSVADHSFWVAVFVGQLAMIHNKCNIGDTVDVGRVVHVGLYHDMEECVTGDLPFLVKRALGSSWDPVEELATRQMVGYDYELIVETPANSFDNQLLKAADLLDVCRYAKAEADLGNTQFKRIYSETIKRLRDMNIVAVNTFMDSCGMPQAGVDLPKEMTHL